ncbi:MAG: septum formation initiator family protein [Corynebacterium sp.]|nr:septum formation initiator family protein [Corynebacterium sp.]
MARRRAVPVAHRVGEKPERVRRSPVTAAATPLTPAHWALLIVVLIVCLIAISMPLRNYFTQRSQILQLEATIAAQEIEKAQVSDEIAKYSDPAYRDEIARVRLGVTKPGEVAFRIDDPRISTEDRLTTELPADTAADSWYEQLWASLGEVE